MYAQNLSNSSALITQENYFIYSEYGIPFAIPPRKYCIYRSKIIVSMFYCTDSLSARMQAQNDLPLTSLIYIYVFLLCVERVAPVSKADKPNEMCRKYYDNQWMFCI